MSRPLSPAAFPRLSPALEIRLDHGLSAGIDAVAQAARPQHRFLRYGWFAAALAAYGGEARTLTVSRDGEAAIALPMVRLGPGWAGVAAVPGCYWPYRSFPAREDVGLETFEALFGGLGRAVRALRIGPIYDDDPTLCQMRRAADALGWRTLDRFVADSYLLDMAEKRVEGIWPRKSTLKKNRFHEKHLGNHGALDWSFASGADWTDALFDDLAAVEQASWIAAETDGRDAKFTRRGHGAFWRTAAADPVLADMMWAAVLRVDGRPAAFSFDLNLGALKHAVANSFDPAFAKHSPGRLLYYRNLIRALGDGITTVDWGAGDSGYKSVIGAQKGPAIRDWLFVKPGLPAIAATLLRRTWKHSGQG
ncbi:GNAT family N-acetyltransferase [Stakelama saccharophila]|uniref:GNAT family N-acetyltransferase n=1 Tax=Stakelama saccharophila TaxID=3075605 RepID=A0ABZ0BDL3_9SPHN|nr:GNAT family N-acetyltransferase [Stakelama sp. W311]WNO54414.1 GNAT family N-acetyltransferase [Stakelama sp. W311]